MHRGPRFRRATPSRHALILGSLEPLVEIALIGTDAGLVHRAAVALARLVDSAQEMVVGKEGEPIPEHAMLALGALSQLTT